MNIHEYKNLVYDFFQLFFNSDYIKVSVPFVISISLFWFISFRLYYQTKCKFMNDKFSREYLILHTELVRLRGSQHQMSTQELYPTLSTHYGIQPNSMVYNEILPSAPPQYIVRQGDFVQI